MFWCIVVANQAADHHLRYLPLTSWNHIHGCSSAISRNSTVSTAVSKDYTLVPWARLTSFSVHITHYSPFGNQNEIYGSNVGKLIDDPTLNEIGKKYDKSGAQVALAWGIAIGHSVIPKSKTPHRIEANLHGDFKLSEEDVKKVESIDKKLRFNDSSVDFGYNFFTDLDGKK